MTAIKKPKHNFATSYAVAAHNSGENLHLLLGYPDKPDEWVKIDAANVSHANDLSGAEETSIPEMHLDVLGKMMQQITVPSYNVGLPPLFDENPDTEICLAEIFETRDRSTVMIEYTGSDATNYSHVIMGIPTSKTGTEPR